MEVDLKYEKCKTCKYFLRHYIKRHSTFNGINCGHCVNSQLNDKRARNKYVLRENCEFWQSTRKSPRNEGNVLKTLSGVCKNN